MKKNIISLAIVFLLVCALVPVGVFAHPEDATEEAMEEYTKKLAELDAEYTEEVAEAQAKVDEKLAELQEKLSEAQAAGDAEEVVELEAEIAEVKEELAELEAEYAEELVEIEEELHEEEQEELEEELEDGDSAEQDDEIEETEEQDTEVEESEADDEEAEESAQEEFDFEDVDEVSKEHDVAESATEYARAYYFLTDRILTAEAVLAFLQENYPDVDRSALESYKAELVALQDSITEESDFHATKEQAKALIDAAREELQTIVEENNVDKDALHRALKEHKEASQEDDAAKAAWGLARSSYAKAKAIVVLARLHNYEKVAERYADKVSTENLESFKSILAQLDAIADQVGAAAENFNKEDIDALVDQAKELTKEAKELAKDMRDEVREAHKAARETAKEERKAARDEAKETVKNAREEAKDEREQAKEAREKHGSARGVTAEEDKEESEIEKTENEKGSEGEGSEKEDVEEDNSDEEE